MAEAKPVQPFADRAAMHRHAMHRGHFRDDLVQRQVALDRQPVPKPGGVGGQLALGMVALSLRQKAPALALQDYHVVHETRRHTKVPRRHSMPMPFLNKRDNPAAKFHRMCSSHSDPLHLARSANHKPLNLGILNRKKSDVL